MPKKTRRDKGEPAGSVTSLQRRTRIGFALALALGTLATYWPVVHHEFLTYDDGAYVTGNAFVRDGLTLPNMHAAFTEIVASNWQPITILSHQLDATLFGLNPGGHHFMNVIFHTANTLLIYLVLAQMTGGWGRAAMVAGLFALHPLHVESVAWIAERKDVLSTLFMALTILAYHRYVKKPGAAAFVLVAGLFALGLMAKSMLVTLPFVLLLLDYWPLQRIDLGAADRRARAIALVREKIPLFALTVIISTIALITQRKGAALQSIDVYPPHERLANAIVSYAVYLAKMIWPHPLAIFYPHPRGAIVVWMVIVSAAFLVAVTLLALRHARRHPYGLVGWLWYLGTLVPVIGLVQIGAQARADRYTYIPLIGIFIALVWLAVVLEKRVPRRALAVVGVVVLAACAIATRAQLRHWRDTETLFRHALNVTENNFPAHVNLGLALSARGEYDEAADHFAAATAIEPNAVEAWYNLGGAYFLQGNYRRAREAYQKAVELQPSNIDSRLKLAATHLALNNPAAAAQELDAILQQHPDHPAALQLRELIPSR